MCPNKWGGANLISGVSCKKFSGALHSTVFAPLPSPSFQYLVPPLLADWARGQLSSPVTQVTLVHKLIYHASIASCSKKVTSPTKLEV